MLRGATIHPYKHLHEAFPLLTQLVTTNTTPGYYFFYFVGIDALPTSEGGIVSVLQHRLGVTYIYPTGGEQAIDWAVQILIYHVNPPHKIELSFNEVRADNAQEICNIYHCPQSTAETVTN